MYYDKKPWSEVLVKIIRRKAFLQNESGNAVSEHSSASARTLLPWQVQQPKIQQQQLQIIFQQPQQAVVISFRDDSNLEKNSLQLADIREDQELFSPIRKTERRHSVGGFRLNIQQPYKRSNSLDLSKDKNCDE